MLRFLGPGSRLCDGLTRREILRVGGLGLLGGGGLNLAQLATAAGPGDDLDRSFGRAKSCIVLFLMGGPPQHSTWDPKPDAPAEVRGDYKPIATNVPGMMISELLPMTAKVADKVCLLRAVSTGDNAHSSSGYYMLTGRPHQPQNVENANPGAPNDTPSLGAMLGHFDAANAALPPTITLPHRIFNTDGSVWPGQDAGFLGRGGDPWLLNGKLTPEGYKIQEIDLPNDLDPARVGRRRDLVDDLRRGLDAIDRDPSTRVLDGHSRRAFDLLRSSEARRAFRLEDEPESSRNRYGATPFGQSTLLARRLVEAGVRLVQVNWYRGAEEPPANPCWDSHTQESARLKDVLAPPTDRAFSALIEDLSTPPGGCSTKPWSSAWPSSVGAPGSTPPGAGTIGAPSFPSPWPGGGSRGARSSAPPTRSAPSPRTAGSAPRTSPPPSSTASATTPSPNTSTASAAPTQSAGGKSSGQSSDLTMLGRSQIRGISDFKNHGLPF